MSMMDMEDDDESIIIPISEWPVTPAKISTTSLHSKLQSVADSDVDENETDYKVQHSLKSQTIIKPQVQHRSSLIQQSASVNNTSEPPSKVSKLDKTCLFEMPSQEKTCPEDSISNSGTKTSESLFTSSSSCDSDDLLEKHESMAQVRVARWWRRYKHLHLKPLPLTNNPNTLLFHISRTTECISFLLEDKRQLQKKSGQFHFRDRADIHAAIASIDDWLGNYKTALDSISCAVELDPTMSKYKWLKAKLEKQCKVIDIQKVKMKLLNTVPCAFPAMLEVERISAKNLGKDDFIKCFIHQRRPVILLDVVKDMTTSAWDLDFIKSAAGSIKTTVKHAVPLSVEWAKLEESQEVTVGEFIDQVKGDRTNDYLFDWSLPIHCPQLSSDLTIPKYFSDNYLQKTFPGSLYHDSWPSLFIAPKGTVSNLHVDAFASHFWMALFQGEKRWTFFDADDTPLLYPQYFHSMDPVFSVDLSHPNVKQWPLLALTNPRQCVLQSGELLFVPAGSPHYVENLSNSLAVSSNFVDQSNFKQVCEELRINALQDPRAADLLQQLENPAFLQVV